MLDLLDVAKPNVLKTSVIPDIHRTQFTNLKFELGRWILSFMFLLSIAALLMCTSRLSRGYRIVRLRGKLSS